MQLNPTQAISLNRHQKNSGMDDRLTEIGDSSSFYSLLASPARSPRSALSSFMPWARGASMRSAVDSPEIANVVLADRDGKLSRITSLSERSDRSLRYKAGLGKLATAVYCIDQPDQVYQWIQSAIDHLDWGALKAIAKHVEGEVVASAVKSAPAYDVLSMLHCAAQCNDPSLMLFLVNGIPAETLRSAFSGGSDYILDFIHTIVDHNAVVQTLLGAVGSDYLESEALYSNGKSLLAQGVTNRVSESVLEHLLQAELGPNRLIETATDVVLLHSTPFSLLMAQPAGDMKDAKVTLCLQHGADPNVVDGEGKTPLIHAVIQRSPDVDRFDQDNQHTANRVEELLGYGADFTLKDNDGHDALWYARHHEWSTVDRADNGEFTALEKTGHPAAEKLLFDAAARNEQFFQSVQSQEFYPFAEHQMGLREPSIEAIQRMPCFKTVQQRHDWRQFAVAARVYGDAIRPELGAESVLDHRVALSANLPLDVLDKIVDLETSMPKS